MANKKEDHLEEYIPYVVGGAIVGALVLNYLSNNHFSFATSTESGASNSSSSGSKHHPTATSSTKTSHKSKTSHHTAPPPPHPTHHSSAPPITHHDSPLTTHHINTHITPHTAVHKVTHPAITHQTASTPHNTDTSQTHSDNNNMGGLHQAYGLGHGGGPGGGHHSSGNSGGHTHGNSGHSGNSGTGPTSPTSGTITTGGGRNHITGNTGHQHSPQGNINNSRGIGTKIPTTKSSNIPATHSNPQHTRPITKGKPLHQAIDGNPVKLDPTMKSSNKPKQNPNPTPSNPKTNPTKITPEYPTTGKYIGGEQFGHDWDPAYKMGSDKPAQPAKDGKPAQPAVNNDHASSRNITYQNFKSFEANSYVKMGQPTDGRKNAFGDKAAYAMIEAGGPPQSNDIPGCCNYMIGLHGDGTIYSREEGNHVKHPTEGRMPEDGKQIPGIGALKPGETIGLKMILLRNLKGSDNGNHVRLIGKVDRNNDGNWHTIVDKMDPYGVGNDGKQYPVLTDISMPVNGKPPVNFAQEARTRFDQLGAATPYNNYTAVHEIDSTQLDNFGNPISRSGGNSGTTSQSHYSIVPTNTKGYGNIMGSTTQHHTSPLSLRKEVKTQLPVGYNNYLYLYNNS